MKKPLFTFLSIFAMVFFLISATGAENQNYFSIELKERVYDANQDVTTFHYQIKGSGEGHDLSHWGLAVDPSLEIVEASHAFEVMIKPDPTTNVTGIKFDIPVKVDSSLDFWIKVKGNCEGLEMTTAFKAGQDIFTQSVIGPSCAEAVLPVEESKQDPPVGDEVPKPEQPEGELEQPAVPKVEELISETAPVKNPEVVASDPIQQVGTINGGRLPDTASPWYNLMLLSSLALFATGLGWWRIRIRADKT
ncbi:hypothetical protein [Ammoniphilus sp. YIM 78166]|uniref:hypothetical protein n=1 Tax=Ammoniphilus sp. YIM 78166 TaxID=1644106 RepID=UPI0010703501|nr:hypothetical protein [Ammoniphilus sp. YIM 78166]